MQYSCFEIKISNSLKLLRYYDILLLYIDTTLWDTTAMHCEKNTADDFLQQSLGFTPRSTVVHDDLFAVVDP